MCLEQSADLVPDPRILFKHLAIAGLEHPDDGAGWSPVQVSGHGIGLLWNRERRFVVWSLITNRGECLEMLDEFQSLC